VDYSSDDLHNLMGRIATGFASDRRRFMPDRESRVERVARSPLVRQLDLEEGAEEADADDLDDGGMV
jgi:hypothetical protein